MSDNQAGEAEGRVRNGTRNFTGHQAVKHDSQADEARTTVEDQGNNLVDALPGRGSE
jgi:hypothetical protein